MKIVAHDENSLTNLLFTEIHRHEKIRPFLEAIKWTNFPGLPFEVKEAELHQQINFSEFGKPDVLMLVSDAAQQMHVIIVEVKLGGYLESCSYGLENGKFNNRNNSKLNNQLTLRYRFMKSLSSLKTKGYVTEEEHVPQSPYSEDILRRCKKALTCQFFKSVLGGPFHFYLVTLTLDIDSPFSVVKPGHHYFPLLFDSSKGTMEDFRNLGSISWYDCEKLLRDTDNHFSASFRIIAKIHQEEGPLGSPEHENELVQGRQIVLYMGQPALLTKKQFSYKIRALVDGEFVVVDQGANDKRKHAEMQRRITFLEKAPLVGIDNVTFWKERLSSYKAPTVRLQYFIEKPP